MLRNMTNLGIAALLAAMICVGMIPRLAHAQASQSDPSLGTGNVPRPQQIPPSPAIGIDRLTLLGPAELKLPGAQVWEYLSVAKTAYRITYNNDASTKPILIVYADAATLDRERAWLKLNDLGLVDLAERHAADIYLVTARNGQSFESFADYSLFDRLLYQIPYRNNTSMGNTKLVGVGEGATFVNSVLSAHLHRIAGVLTFGGTKIEVREAPMPGALAGSVPVPAYLAGNPPTLALAQYKAANCIPDDLVPVPVADGVVSYVSPSSPLRRVMVDDASATPAAAIKAGFTHLLQHNLRILLTNNFWVPDATQQAMANSAADAWLLPLMALDGSSPLEYSKVTDGVVGGQGGKEWLQFIPKALLRPGHHEKVPLVVFFHGGGNDNGQVFTSGWTQIAEREGLILVAPEHQVGELDIETFIKELVQKYPIDERRLYATGLSGGGFKTNIVTLLMGERFAAVAAFAAGDFVHPGDHANLMSRLFRETRYPDRIDDIIAEFNARNIVVPYAFSAGSYDRSFPLWYPWADNAPWQVRPMLNLIGRINHIDKLARLTDQDIDTRGSGNPVMGIALEGQRYVDMVDTKNLVGGFSDPQGHELVLLTSPIGLKHWYYYGSTDFIWNWMKRFSRDPRNHDLYIDDKRIVKTRR